LKKRWKVETLIEELKVWLSADVLRSKTPEGIYKELYARIIGLNLIHWLILKSAQKHTREPERMSLSAALRLAIAYSLKMSVAPPWLLPSLYETLLDHIAFSTVPCRPDRIEPRMIKRERKHYPKLKISRAEWRNMAIAA
jgi:thymidylate synthase ThyX